MFRFLPPAGTSLGARTLWAAARGVFSSADRTDLAAFERLFPAGHVLAANSGRTALWAALRGLRTLRPERAVVVVPAYTCYSVPAAVVRAGLRVRPVEMDPETLDYDFAALEAVPGGDVLCILAGNLFGYVNDLPRIRGIADAWGAFVIDDAAQALGASRAGHAAGTGGDVGLFSLARGKALPAGEGGVVFTESEAIARAVRRELQALPAASLGHNAALWLKMLAGSLLLHPRLYWLPNALPFLKLGVTEYDPGFRATKLSGPARAVAQRTANRLDEFTRARRRNAEKLAAALAGNPAFRVLQPAADCRPSYIRLPLLAREPADRDRALAALQAAGFGASPYYPGAVCDIPGLRAHLAAPVAHCPQAEGIARRLLTLPTHPLVRDADIAAMAAILERIAGQPAVAPAAAVPGSSLSTPPGRAG